MISLRSPSESTTSLYLCSTFSYLKVSLLLSARTLQRIFVYQLYKESITIHLSLASSFFSFCFFFFFFFKFLVEHFYQAVNILKCLPSEEITAPAITTTKHGIVIQFFFQYYLIPLLPFIAKIFQKLLLFTICNSWYSSFS